MPQCINAARKLGELTHSHWDGGRTIQKDSTMMVLYQAWGTGGAKGSTGHP